MFDLVMLVQHVQVKPIGGFVRVEGDSSGADCLCEVGIDVDGRIERNSEYRNSQVFTIVCHWIRMGSIEAGGVHTWDHTMVRQCIQTWTWGPDCSRTRSLVPYP